MTCFLSHCYVLPIKVIPSMRKIIPISWKDIDIYFPCLSYKTFPKPVQVILIWKMKRTINSCKEGCQILHLQTINPFCNLNMSEKRLGKNLIKREVEFVRTLLIQVFFLSLNDPLVGTCPSCNELKTYQSWLVSDQLKL